MCTPQGNPTPADPEVPAGGELWVIRLELVDIRKFPPKTRSEGARGGPQVEQGGGMRHRAVVTSVL